MSEESQPQRRTWLPIAGAGAVALVVVGGAVVWSAIGGGASPVEESAIAACEATLTEAQLGEILGGEVYEPGEWRDYYGVVETHGEADVPLADLDDASVETWEAAAASYEETGTGALAVVWRFEDDSYLQCVVPVADGVVDGSAAASGDLVIASEDSGD
ncbi:hypothetical protein [Demequina sp. NBRC 110056]|uniref:hypothetical protein n=1 Tax=Demequina sp. NBRC 110056 TaxID=1570345 RepID=UPI0009FD88E1|nr:hypothetical protein [Demequina sp. NBRC 110056]